jgi:uncharacterized protein
MNLILARVSIVTVVAAGLAIAALAVVHNAQQLEQEGKIVVAAGNAQYVELAEKFKQDLRKYGVKLEVREKSLFKDKEGRTTLRPLEGRLTLRALVDSDSGISAGFVKGDLVASLQGSLATEKQKDRHTEYSKLHSVGRLFHEPIWVFTRGDLPIRTLRDLKGKRILIGTRDSGARGIARQLLKANGVVDKATATFLDDDLPADAGPLISGTADAAILVLAADTDKVRKLLEVSNIRLMDFTPEADAYTTRFPALSKLVLRQGAVNLDTLIPTDDITLLSTSVALVVRPDMRPKSGFDKNGDPVLFYRAGEFPTANDPEFEVPNAARIVYKSEELPVILKSLAPNAHSLGVPFSYTALVNEHWTAIVGVLGMLAILLPLTRAVPGLYVWMVRRRLVYWYRQLKALERNLDSGGVNYDATAMQAEFERIESNVKAIRLPPYYSNQLYDLRGHIDLVRQRIAMKPVQHRMAAE